MKKEQKEFEEWANQQLRAIQKLLLLDSYRLEPIESHEDAKFLESKYRYPYKEIVIRYGLDVNKYWPNEKEYLYNALVHEMCHPITDPFYTKAITRHTTKDEVEDERERLTDYIANIILKLKPQD